MIATGDCLTGDTGDLLPGVTSLPYNLHSLNDLRSNYLQHRLAYPPAIHSHSTVFNCLFHRPIKIIIWKVSASASRVFQHGNSTLARRSIPALIFSGTGICIWGRCRSLAWKEHSEFTFWLHNQINKRSVPIRGKKIISRQFGGTGTEQTKEQTDLEQSKDKSQTFIGC